MSEFLDAATTPVALVFAVPLVISLVLWMVSIVGVFDFDADGSDGLVDGALESLGLAGVPPLVVFTIVSLIGWFVAVVAALFVLDPLTGVSLLLASFVVVGAASAAALFIGSRIARPLGALMITATAPSGAELVGHGATVRSGKVDASFGYADAVWDDGNITRVDIRDSHELGLTSGDRIRLMDWNAEAGTYKVKREKDLFPDTGDN